MHHSGVLLMSVPQELCHQPKINRFLNITSPQSLCMCLLTRMLPMREYGWRFCLQSYRSLAHLLIKGSLSVPFPLVISRNLCGVTQQSQNTSCSLWIFESFIRFVEYYLFRAPTNCCQYFLLYPGNDRCTCNSSDVLKWLWEMEKNTSVFISFINLLADRTK